MYTGKKKILDVSLCVLILAISFIVGKAIADAEGASLVASVSESSFSLREFLSDLRNDKASAFNALYGILPFFRSQIIQFLLIFIFSFTPFNSVTNCAVFTLRGISLGYSTGLILSLPSFDVNVVCYAVSYFMITAVMLIFIFNLWDIVHTSAQTASFGEKFSCIGASFVLFLMTGGASILIRLIPIVVVSTGA